MSLYEDMEENYYREKAYLAAEEENSTKQIWEDICLDNDYIKAQPNMGNKIFFNNNFNVKKQLVPIKI